MSLLTLCDFFGANGTGMSTVSLLPWFGSSGSPVRRVEIGVEKAAERGEAHSEMMGGNWHDA